MKKTTLFLLVSLIAFSACSRKALSPLEMARQEFVQTNWDETIRLCDEAIQAEPQNVAALVLRGRAYIDKGNIGLAIHDFTAAIKINPKNPEPLFQRSIAFQKIGKTNQAIADAQRARKLDPKYAKAFLNDLPSSYSFLDDSFEEESQESDASENEETKLRGSGILGSQPLFPDSGSFQDMIPQDTPENTKDSSILSSLPANLLNKIPQYKNLSQGGITHLFPSLMGNVLKTPIDLSKPSEQDETSEEQSDKSKKDPSGKNRKRPRAKLSRFSRNSSGSLPDYSPYAMGPAAEIPQNFFQARASLSTGIQSNPASQVQEQANTTFWRGSPWNRSGEGYSATTPRSPSARSGLSARRRALKPNSNLSQWNNPSMRNPTSSWYGGIIYPQTLRATGISKQPDR